MQLHKNDIKIAALALLMIGSAAGATAASLDMSNEYGAGTLIGATDKHFAELVAANTDGSVDITNHFGGGLGIKSADAIDAVGDGVVPLATFPIQAASGVNKLFLVSNLPFLASTAGESVALQQVAMPHFEKLLAAENQKLLYITSWPSAGIWSKEPLTQPESFSGARVRTNDPIATTMLQSVGGSPVQISWGDVVPQLQANAIEMVHTSNAGGVLGKLWEYLPHYTDMGWVLSLNVTTMNLDAYNALTADERNAIDAAAAETQTWTRDRLVEDITANDEICIENGTIIVQVNDVPTTITSAFRAATKPIIDDWLVETGETGQALLTEYLSKTGKSL